ncbi:c2H2-type domain-containing protein [Trichonephila clavipes]|nr:c2H2-type domain-containing protein [Trichonephila clavipes]
MIKNVEFKTPNNEVLQETNLARLYDDMSQKIVKESEDFEGRDSGWTLDEILRLEVRTNRYSPFRGSSSFIEVPKQIAETKAIINVINKKDSQCFMWSILAALYPNTSNPNKTSSYVPHLNKLNFDGISFPTPLNEVKKFSKMNDIGINIYSFEEDLKIFPLLISDIVCEKHIELLYVKNGEFGHYCFIKSLSRLVSKQLSKHQHKTFICKRCLSAFQTEYKLLQHNEMCIHKNPARVVMPSETNLFENFRKICMQTYKLDPCWYFTTPALSWDAMLLHTKVAIELFTDYDMLLFIEKGVRGGISQCCNRYAIANNRYMSNFNPDDEIKYLMYLDANNLYGYAMSKYLPLKDFVWSDNDLTEQDILNLSDESDVGYILEVDLEYPSDLHDKHSDFPLAPENKPPPNSVEKNNSTRPLNSKIKANAGEKQLNSSVGTKQLNSTGENNSTRQYERNNSTGENNSTQQQERTTQLGSRNETTQLVSRNETTQLCTAVDRLQPPASPLQQNRLFLPTDNCEFLEFPAVRSAGCKCLPFLLVMKCARLL